MGTQKSKLEIDYDIESVKIETLHISYYVGFIGMVDYGEGDLSVSRKEIEEAVGEIIEKAKHCEDAVIVVYKTYIDSLTKTVKKEAILLEDERQEPMTRGIQNDDCCFGRAIKLFFTKGYIYGVFFTNGKVTARISFY